MFLDKYEILNILNHEMPEIARDGVTCVFCQEPGSKTCSKCHSVTYCSQDCQRKDWTRHKRLCVPVVIAQVPGKGKGLLACRDIKAGEMILKDKIVVTWPRSNMASEEYLFNQIEALPQSDKESFWKLTCMKQFEDNGNKSFRQAIGILRNNAMTYNQTRDNVDLCLALALINNSCSPNCATNALLENPNFREVRAVEDIRKGEEITVPYENSYMYHNTEERQKRIKENWDFDCICERCKRGDVPEELELKASLDRLSGKMMLVVSSSSLLKIKNWEKLVEESVKEIDLLQKVSFASFQLPFDSVSLIKNAQLGMGFNVYIYHFDLTFLGEILSLLL